MEESKPKQDSQFWLNPSSIYVNPKPKPRYIISQKEQGLKLEFIYLFQESDLEP
jgi:hypothetical protein